MTTPQPHRLIQQVLIIGIPPKEAAHNPTGKYIPHVLFAFPPHRDNALQTEVTLLLI